MIYYKQCMMKRKNETTTSWIPEKFAIKDKIIKLENRETGKWTDGWRIVIIGLKRRESKEVVERSQDHKKTRKASDI